MEDFKVIIPSPLLAPYVKHYWILKTGSVKGETAATVPVGLMNLIFHRGTRLFSVRDNKLHPRAFISGQETDYANLFYQGQVDMISVVFNPVGIKAFFNFPADLVNNQRVSAGELGDKELALLEQSIADTEDDRMCILLIEQFLTGRLRDIAEHNLKRIGESIRLINSGQIDVAFLADAACLGVKQFKRVFSEHVGANPKEFTRTIRFQRALHLLETNPQLGFAALAADCGFYDQSHMIREFKTFSGYTPNEYLAVCLPHSDYFS